jgi:hypothetical protein
VQALLAIIEFLYDCFILFFIYFGLVLVVDSCAIEALRENFVDRPESYYSFRGKGCIFLVHKKMRTVFPFHTQPDTKQGIKIFLKHFPTTLARTITNLTNI